MFYSIEVTDVVYVGAYFRTDYSINTFISYNNSAYRSVKNLLSAIYFRSV